MVKLSAELISQAMQFTNPVRDRELDLRGYKIPAIENLGATLDQFDTLDLSDNDIRKLDGFPLLKRLKNLVLNHNRIVRIQEGLENYLPNLETLILTGNLISELADLDPLATLTKLRILSLLHCPVVTRQHYRLYVAFKLPHLKLLDFRIIQKKERDEAVALFKSKKGRELQREIASKSKTFVPGAKIPDKKKPTQNSGQNPQDIAMIKKAIQNASSLEEVEKLSRLLQKGDLNTSKLKKNGEQKEDIEEMDSVD